MPIETSRRHAMTCMGEAPRRRHELGTASFLSRKFGAANSMPTAHDAEMRRWPKTSRLREGLLSAGAFRFFMMFRVSDYPVVRRERLGAMGI